MADDFIELECWQLARELKQFVIPITQRPAVRRHVKFREQLDDAASSATRNIAEGFGRYDHKEFANFMKIALASEFEVRDCLIDAYDRKYISQKEMNDGLRLARRAIGAATKLRHHLLTTPTPPPRPRPASKPSDNQKRENGRRGDERPDSPST
jgi:four helix bundle protein